MANKINYSWIESQFAYLTSNVGIYKLGSNEDFFFDPTPGFYGFISQGTTKALNEGIKILADFIGIRTCPIIEEWRGSSNPLVTITHDWMADNVPAGLIKYHGPFHSKIELNITNKHSPYIMGAILAHELTHHYLDTKNVRLTETEDNEKLTDLTTSFLGLGKLTLNGYEPISWELARNGQSTTYTYNVGYLSPYEMAMIHFYITKYRALTIDSAVKELSDKSLELFDSVKEIYKVYSQKKLLVGERQCLHCNNYVSFTLNPEDENVYCPSCGWEWNAILEKDYKKRNNPWNKFRTFLKNHT